MLEQEDLTPRNITHENKKLNVTQPTDGMEIDIGCDLLTLFISQKSNQQHSVCGNTTTCQCKKEKKRESKSFCQQVQ